MTLNWSTEKVKYFKDHPDELWITINKGKPGEQEDVNTETKSLIFGAMAVSIGSISYKSAPDYYARWKFYEKYDGFYLFSTYDGNEDIKTYLTPNVVVKHLGLSMNVETQTETVWVKRVAKSYAQDFKNGYKDQLITEAMIKKFLRGAKEEFENSFYKTKVEE